MQDASEVSNFLGRAAIAEAVGVVETAVHNAERAGQFPAHWYPVIRDMLRKRRRACPDHLFRFQRNRKAS